MFLGEIVFGYITNSIALVTDAFHMLSDIIALSIAHYAITLTKKKSYSSKYTYGWQRAETLGALVNAVFLLSLCFTIFLTAIERLFSPVPITQPITVLIVGGIGLLVNLCGMLLFHEHGHSHPPEMTVPTVPPLTGTAQVLEITIVPDDGENRQQIQHNQHQHHQHQDTTGSLNMKGAFLHVMGDALGSVGVIISATIIQWSNWEQSYYMDPIVSILIAGLIVCTTWKLFTRTCHILMHVAPPSVSIEKVKSDIVNLQNVQDLHEFHVWQLSDSKTIASVHVILKPQTDRRDYMAISDTIKKILHQHEIHNTTVQLEMQNGSGDETMCLLPCDDGSCHVTTCCPD